MSRTIAEIFADLHAARQECERYEAQYEMLSEDFFRLYLAGQVIDEADLQMWAGFCKAARRCEREYEETVLVNGLPHTRLVTAAA